jgi:hypothetical protein
LSLIKEVYAMGMCRPVYPSACLDAIDALGRKARPLSEAIAKVLHTDTSLQAIIKTQTGIDPPYNVGNLTAVFGDKTVRDEIIKRTQDTYVSLVTPQP